jgi:sec-independent protein translocase protein TatA
VLTSILQPTHLIIVAIVALLVLGPKRLPEAGRAPGQGLAQARPCRPTGRDGVEGRLAMMPGGTGAWSPGRPYALLAGVPFVRGVGLGTAVQRGVEAAYQLLDSAQVPRAIAALNTLRQIGRSSGTTVLAVILQHEATPCSLPARGPDRRPPAGANKPPSARKSLRANRPFSPLAA